MLSESVRLVSSRAAVVSTEALWLLITDFTLFLVRFIEVMDTV